MWLGLYFRRSLRKRVNAPRSLASLSPPPQRRREDMEHYSAFWLRDGARSLCWAEGDSPQATLGPRSSQLNPKKYKWLSAPGLQCTLIKVCSCSQTGSFKRKLLFTVTRALGIRNSRERGFVYEFLWQTVGFICFFTPLFNLSFW